MTKEQFDQIIATTGITFNKNGSAVVAGQRLSDDVADAMLKAYNTTVNELRTTLKELSKVPTEAIPEDLRYKDNMSIMDIVCPAFTASTKWNKTDKAIFGYFSITRASEGGGFLLLINNDGTQYRFVSLGTNYMENLASVTEACTKMTIVSDDGTVSTLYDHIQKRYDKLLERALGVYKQRPAKEFGEWTVRAGLPSIMINNYKLRSVQEAVEVTAPSGSKTTMYRAHSLFFGGDGGAVSPFDCVARHFDSLAAVSERITQMPKLYSNDTNEPALYHIDLDSLKKPGPHPTWDKYLNRFRQDEGEVMKAFVWSIYDVNNSSRQMLYIYDPDGFSGKSVFEKAIASGLGEQCVAALQKDSLNNQFSMSKIWNKRLVCIDDNKNPLLILSEKMHMILGSGLADVEYKNKNSFVAKMQCKVIASGNVRLRIDPYAKHERTRVIIVQPHVTDEMLKEFALCDKDGNVVRDSHGGVQLLGDASFEENLISEFPAFLADCEASYKALCPKDSSITLSPAMEDTLYSMSDDLFDIIDDFVEETLDFDDKEAVMSVIDFQEAVQEIHDRLTDHIRKSETDRVTQDDIIQHLMKRHGIVKKNVRVAGRVKKCYVGVQRLPVNRMVTSNTTENKPISFVNFQNPLEMESA